MEPARWQRVQDLFEAALDLDSAGREQLLASEPDAGIVEDVRAMLAIDEADESPLDRGLLAGPMGLGAGTVVGEYVIEERIGAGAFGVVYRAVHPVLNKSAAVKVLDRRFASDATAVQRFVTEARAASTIGHPGIVDVFGFGELADGSHYYLMGHVDGPSLAAFVMDEAPLDLERALSILEPLADALDAAHRQGVVHRDLKPANVMLQVMSDGRVIPKLVDFGIAKLVGTPDGAPNLTQTGATLGTPAYMAPEQAMGQPVDASADLYALGVMAFEMLTGRRPFVADSTVETLMKHVNEPPPVPSSIRPELPPHVDAAVLAMLAKLPAERPSTATLAVAALKPSGAVSSFAAPVRDPASTGPSFESFEASPLAGAVDGTVAPSSRMRWAAIGVVGSSILVTIAVMLTRPSEAPVEAVAPPTPAKVAPTPPPVESEPAAPIRTDVRINGTPHGAQILDVDGNVLGTLPTAVTLEGPSVEHELMIKKSGYKTARIRFVPKEKPVVEVSLDKILHRDLESPF